MGISNGFKENFNLPIFFNLSLFFMTIYAYFYLIPETQTMDRIQSFLRKEEIGHYMKDLQARSSLKHIKNVVLRNVKSKETDEAFKKLTDRIGTEKETFFFVIIDEGNIFRHYSLFHCSINSTYSPLCC